MFVNFYYNRIDIAVITVLVTRERKCTNTNSVSALGSEISSIILGISNSISRHNFHHKVSQSDSFRNCVRNSVREDPIFKKPREIPSNLNREVLPDPCKALEKYTP